MVPKATHSFIIGNDYGRPSGEASMTDDEKEEVADSQKMSKRDKKELQEGACVNCAIFGVIFMIVSMLMMVL
jgi:hypothetical protein